MRDFILTEITRLARENGGKAPGVLAFASATGIAESKWRGVYWSRWSDALQEVGLEPNSLQGKLDSSFVLEQVIELALAMGRMPSFADMQLHKRVNPLIPTQKTLSRHFGSAAGLQEAVAQHALTIGDETLQRIVPVTYLKSTKTGTQSNDGFVYLLKSGLHYKVGRTETIARRINEIRTTLPEAVELIHSIKTDDPAGIEAYWHRRFAERRMNGEWFALTVADVKAFLRRSFQ